MKRTYILVFLLIFGLVFSTALFAGANDNFKSSPLFSHSLNSAIENMENQGAPVSNNSGSDTFKPGCIGPEGLDTRIPDCETHENTCEGFYTCSYATICGESTCAGVTCQSTCYGEETCQSTCEETCESTCSNCPNIVKGKCGYYGDFNYLWWNTWGERWVKLYNNLGQYIRMTYFDHNGLYEMESGDLFDRLIVKAHAKRPFGTVWKHIIGETPFTQFNTTETKNIDLNEDYETDP